MARIVYALNGQGRGHTSRALAVTHTLRRRGHEVTLCGGGEAADRLRAQGESVIDVPAPREVVRGNRARLIASACRNAPLAFGAIEIIEDLAGRIADLHPDVIVSDFEPFSPRAARRLGVPAVALDHQHLLSETRCDVPLRYAASAAVTRLGIGVMAPRRLFQRIVVPTFYAPPLRSGSRAVLVPPILRRDILITDPCNNGHVLVYLNHPAGTDRMLDQLRRVDARFVVYNVVPPDPSDYPNCTFRPPSREGFVADLAACRAVVSTAGFTLLSEALHLGKPALVVPNRGFFEQTLNALHLRRTGFGAAALGRFTASILRAFLADLPQIEPGGPVGNERATEYVETVCGTPTDFGVRDRLLRAVPTG